MAHMETESDMNPPTVPPTSKRPQAPTNAQLPPRGLSFEDRHGIPMPYLARWREPGGKKRSQSFSTPKLRWAFAAQWAKQRAHWGKVAPMVHPKKAETWKLFAELTGDADPLEVARFWLRYRTERAGDMITRDAIKKFMEVRTKQMMSGDAASHMRLHLKRLNGAFGDKKLGEISTDDLRQWINSLTDPETSLPMQPYTVRHHIRSIKYFFRHCVREKWMDESPCERIDAPRVEAGEIHVLSAANTERLFSVNRDALCVGRLALEAFGGLRFTSAARISAAEISHSERGIIMPGAKHKSGRRHYVDGYPDNLWAWLKYAPTACWDIPPRLYLDQKSQCFERAQVANPGNVLRHSFCTYHVALHKDAARTAVLLTHRSPTMLYQHYRGHGSEADAKRYFSITP